tara:strand:+ start:402 stop:656 length:255 start_codon:yes stop_codon:yes gene_type:complete
MFLIQKAKRDDNLKKGITNYEESEDDSDEDVEPNPKKKKKMKVAYDVVALTMEDVDNLQYEEEHKKELPKISDDETENNDSSLV